MPSGLVTDVLNQKKSKDAFSISDYIIHSNTMVNGKFPLSVTTPQERWSYAVSFPLSDKGIECFSSAETPVLVRVETEILSGEIGISCARGDQSSLIVEVFHSASEGKTTFDLLIEKPSECRRLIVRNTADDIVSSRILIHSIIVYQIEKTSLLTSIRIKRRDYSTEPVPEDGGVETFDQEKAITLNRARLEHLESLDLPVENKRVLDVGCGVGHLSQFYITRGCTVVGVDAREENIKSMQQRYPDVEGYVIDVQVDSLEQLGSFDIVHCYGLLYHLENPIGALRNIASICKKLLIIETMVCDSSKPMMIIEDETKTFSQALQGIGCRPSPGFITMVLNRIGFRHIYGVNIPPNHEDFLFEWKDNMDTTRDRHNLRCIFIASHEPLNNKNLVPLV